MIKKLLFVLTFSLTIFAFSGCSKQQTASTNPNSDLTQDVQEDAQDSQNSMNKLLSDKHLKVAMSANFKYFETVTVDANGKEVYEGLDIDILDKMSEDLGFTYEIINMPFASLIGALQSNQADFVISGMSYTDERAESVDFSDKYATAKIGVLIKSDSNITSVKDLNGKKVACSAGTNYENIVKAIEGTELVTFDGQAAITQELIMDRVDASITGGTAAKKVSEETEGLSYFIIDPSEMDLGNLNTYNIAFPKGSELVSIFNDEITKLAEDGTLNELIIKWLGEEYVD